MSFLGLSESDRIRRKKGAATYTNFAALLSQQSGCSISGCTATNCIIRYQTYEYAQTVATGQSECTGCTCLADIDAATGNTGAAAWATYISGSGSDVIFNIQLDTAGNIYVCGQYSSTGTVTVKNVSGTTQTNSSITLPAPTSSSGIAAFLIKYNSAGQAQWATYLQGSVNASASQMAIDSSNNIYICGDYNSASTVTLQNASGNSQSSSSITLASTTQPGAFLCKYNSAGQAQWATYFDGTGGTEGFRAIAVDSNSNVYVQSTYTSSGSVTIKNVSGTGQTNSSITVPASTPSSSMVFIKYNSSGIAQWATYLSASGVNTGFQMATDSSANIYICGSYTSGTTVTLKDASGTTQTNSSVTLAAVSSSATFLIKYNTSGVAQWATYLDASGSDFGYGLALDNSANIYLQTYYSGTAPVTVYNAYLNTQSPSAKSLPPSVGVYPPNTALIKYDSSGVVLWATYLANALPYAVAVGQSNLYATGYYSNATTLNVPSVIGNTQTTSATSLPGVSGYNAYLLKYNLSGQAQWSVNLVTASSGFSVAADLSGGVYMGGNYVANGFNIPSATTTGQTPSSVTLPTANTSNDAFIIKYI